MTSIQPKQTFPLPGNYEHSGYDIDDSDNIPYHAREYAQPFTYGTLPKGFKTCVLNHVTFEQIQKSSSHDRSPISLLPSPSTMRKSTRPSISPSRPVLRKTPSRQEFEKMLMDRREQTTREQKNAIEWTHNGYMGQELDELQEKFNKSDVLCSKKTPTSVTPDNELIRHIEPMYLPNAANINHVKLQRKYIIPPPKYLMYEFALNNAEQLTRMETPAFPLTKISSDDCCVSPYSIVPVCPVSSYCMDIVNGETEGSSQCEISINKRVKKHKRRSVIDPHVIEPHLVKFIKDSSKFWYKPHITREESLSLLCHAAPGTFIIRKSTTYRNAYGLVVRVARPPHGAAVQGAYNNSELVRHFLIESTTSGVHLKGCTKEPMFTSLSALVYQHSIVPLDLPCRLIIPDRALLHCPVDTEIMAVQKPFLAQEMAFHVFYLFTCDMESLTGDEAIRNAVNTLHQLNILPQPTEVYLKVSYLGITLTDNTRHLFFRRHYIAQNISHICTDPENRFWAFTAFNEGLEHIVKKTIFAFVARPLPGTTDNQCHVFCDLEATQPATAIISFANKVLPMYKVH